MKHIILLLAVLAFSCGLAGAQDNRSWGIYGSLQFTQTKYTGLHGSINVHWHQKHALSIGLAWITRDAGNLPKDYAQYLPKSFVFNPASTVPESFYIWTLGYSRYLPIDRAGKLRLRLQAGLSAGLFEGPENFRLVFHPSSGGFLSFPDYSAYEYDYVSRNLYGITLAPALEYAPGRGFGFTAGATACISSQRFCAAAEFGFLFGRVRNRGARH